MKKQIKIILASLMSIALMPTTAFLSVSAAESNSDNITLTQDEPRVGSIGFLKGSIYPYAPTDTSVNPLPSNDGLVNFVFPTQETKIGTTLNIPLTEDSREKAIAYFADSRGTEEGWQLRLSASSFVTDDGKSSFDATFQFKDVVSEGKLKKVTGGQGNETVTPVHKATREKATVTTTSQQKDGPDINDVIVYFPEVETKDNYTIDLTKTTLDITAKEMAKVKSGKSYTSTIEWQPAILVNPSELTYGL